MEPIRLEIFLDDRTRNGMQSAQRNITGMETQMQEVINILKKELTGLQSAFKDALSTGVSSPSDLADIQALKGKIVELEEELKRLKKQAEIPVKPNIDLSGYITDEIRAMESSGERVKAIIINIQKDIDSLRQKSLESAATGVINPEDTSKIKALEAQVRSLTETLVKYEVAKQDSNDTPVMRYDPAPKLNNVKMSMQQIARELPALAMGPQMFFLAISNNIPIFTDAVASARKEYELMTAAGKKATPIWKQLLTSLFSWQTAMAAAITLTVVYGKEIGEWVKGLFKAKNATLDLLSAEQEMALARSKSSDSIKKERAELDILYAKLKNTSLSTKERTAAVNEWTKRYPEYANILDGENINLSKLESAYKALSKEIYANAVARHYVDKVADLSVKKEKEEIKRLNQRATLMKAQRRVEQAEAEKVAAQQAQQKGLYGSGNRLSIANDELSSANKDLEKQQKIYDDIVNNVKDYDRNIKTIANHVDTLNLFPQPEEGTYDYWKQQQDLAEGVLKEIKSDVKKTLDDAAKEGTDLFSLGIDKSVVETYKKATDQIKEARKKLKVYDNGDGKTTGGTDKSDYRSELADARLRAQQKLEAATVQVMQEGAEKRRKQAKLEYDEELSRIDRQEKKLTEKLNKAKKSGKKVSPDEYKQVQSDAGTERAAALLIYEGELEKINKEVTEKERKKLEEYEKQFQGYIAKRTSTKKDFKTKRDVLQKGGASDETLKELDYQEEKTLEDIDNEFATREEVFKSWAANVVNLNLKELQRLLAEAGQELERAESQNPNDEGLATKRAKVSTLKNTVSSKNNSKEKSKENKKSIKEWSELNRVLGDVENSFNDIGNSVGDVAGDIIKTAGTISTSTLSIIDGITTLSENSAKAIEGTTETAAEAMSTVEKASVILVIISAALKVATAIASLFKRTDYMEEFRKEMAKLNYELALAKLNAEISTDKNSIFGDDLWSNAIKNVNLAKEALDKYNGTLDKIKNRKILSGFAGVTMEAMGLKNTFNSLGSSIANMQVQVQHKTWFRSTKYKSLKDAVPELFNADGTVNQDALEKFIGSDTFKKLSGENQQYLQEMSDYWKAYQEAVEKVKDYLTDIFGDLGSILTDTLADSWANGTDAATAYYESVSEMLESLGKQMIYSTLFGDIFEKAQKKMLDVTQNADLSADEKFKEYIKLLGSMTDEVLGKQGDFNALLEAYQQMAKDKGFDLFKPESSSQSGQSGSFTAMSQEQGTKLEGLFTSLQDHASGMHQLLEELKQGRSADHEIFVQIAENTAYCKLLEDILEIMTRQDRDGFKMKG
nr:MAG TPA: tail tape measure protein [Caudoviricetes sp.]